MSSLSLTEKKMRQGLIALNEILTRPLTLILGGGGAMVLAHDVPLSTADIDAAPKGLTVEELDPLVKEVARTLSLPTDWLNPYFSTFMHTLPSDYGTRLIPVYEGTSLKALALSATDLLVMKCFAHRQKDVAHARALIRKEADLEKVEAHLEMLLEKRIPGTQPAIDFLQEMRELEEG